MENDGEILLILLISLFIFPAFGAINTDIKNHAIYTTFVDQRDGFYKVFEADNITSKSITFENNTLHISVGDTVIWQNDADPDTRLTLMSDPNIFTGNLPEDYKRFEYTFNESGKYKIYIKEFPTLEQIIFVGEIKKIDVINESNKSINKDSNQDMTERMAPNITRITPNITEVSRTPNSTFKKGSLIFPDLGTIILFGLLLLGIVVSRTIENRYCEIKRRK